MCKHALCEHGNEKPAAPSLAGTVRGWMQALLPLVLLLALPLFARQWVPLVWQVAVLCVFLAWIVGRALNCPSVQIPLGQRKDLAADPEHQAWVARAAEARLQIAERLGQAIRLQTVSYEKPSPTTGDASEGKSASSSLAPPAPRTDPAPFLALHALLASNYPLVHKHLERTVINEYSLVFHWRSVAEQRKTVTPPKPILLIAHLDVVPVPDAHLWSADGGSPFSGKILDGQFVCGRGAIDDKHAVCGLLEAVEDLLAAGHEPARDIYLAFGHDEEVSGNDGAKHIAAWFASKQLSFEWMLDEGLFVMSGMVPGVKDPVAMVCVAEKGFLVSEYKVSVPAALAGHASTPNRESAIGILARALVAMESNPCPSYLTPGSPVRLMFESVASHATFGFRLLFANLAVFAPLLKLVLSMKNTTATLIRTTTALTVVHAGSKANAVPREATALINHRIHPDDSVAGVLAYSNAVVRDERVRIRALDSIAPAPVSSSRCAGFLTIQRALARTMPDVLVSPAMMVGNTDTHHYWSLVQDIFRFSPTRLNGRTITMFHGVDERINIDNYLEVVGFFRNVIKMSDE